MSTQRERITILLVEDNPDDIVLYDRLLQEMNGFTSSPFSFVIIPSESMPEAKGYLEKNKVDVVLISLSGPDLFNDDIFTKTGHIFSQYPMIIVSGMNDPLLPIKAIKAGVHGFFAKADCTASALYSSILFSISGHKGAEALSGAVMIDPLTGLYNRHGLDRSSAHAQSLAARREQGYSALYVDCDKFRLINDKHGTSAGDALLKKIAGILSENFRSSDYIARIGEDDFLVFCAGSAPWTRDSVMGRIERILSGSDVYNGFAAPVAASFGYAFKKHDEYTGIESLIAEAQKAMYEYRRKKKENVKRESLAVEAPRQ